MSSMVKTKAEDCVGLKDSKCGLGLWASSGKFSRSAMGLMLTMKLRVCSRGWKANVYAQANRLERGLPGNTTLVFMPRKA